MKVLIVIIALATLFFSGTCTSCTKWKKQINLEVDASEFMDSLKESVEEEIKTWSHDKRQTDRNIKKKVYYNIYRQVPMLWNNKRAA